MKYLKMVKICPGAFIGLAPLMNDKRVPWQSCGFSSYLVKAKAVQSFDDNDIKTTYLPITDEKKVKDIIEKLALVIAALEGSSVEIVEEVDGDGNENSKEWEKVRDRQKRKQAVRYERRRKAISDEADQPE